MESLMTMLEHPAELLAIARYKLTSILAENKPIEHLSEGVQRCHELLRLTGRTFAPVILSLDPVIREPLCVLYLTLRALDTIEDDLALDKDLRVSILSQFHTHLLEPHWSFHDSNDKDAVLLVEFPTISSQYRQLKEAYRSIILEVCRVMGEGMSQQLGKPILTRKEYDEYCYCASGTVYVAANRMFVASGLEAPSLTESEEMCKHLGLFLQKTNIIRDYLDDVNTGRQYWPKEIWGKYVKELKDFKSEENSIKAVQCLNELVTNSLVHVPHVLQYLSKLQNPSVFRSCALPMVMAIATLERCYNNVEVFRGVVKIRKGEAVRLMLSVSSMGDVLPAFNKYLNKIKSRVPQSGLVSCVDCQTPVSSIAAAAGAAVVCSAAPASAASASAAVVNCWTCKTTQCLIAICRSQKFCLPESGNYTNLPDNTANKEDSQDKTSLCDKNSPCKKSAITKSYCTDRGNDFTNNAIGNAFDNNNNEIKITNQMSLNIIVKGKDGVKSAKNFLVSLHVGHPAYLYLLLLYVMWMLFLLFCNM